MLLRFYKHFGAVKIIAITYEDKISNYDADFASAFESLLFCPKTSHAVMLESGGMVGHIGRDADFVAAFEYYVHGLYSFFLA
jgi:hypothetical protein